ncbi:uncharacterized protein LOC115454730 isoform X2 [Manduca sexta]|nr:uncharacterized protein LOC115454730 isoform X2 [Manduca sexta]
MGILQHSFYMGEKTRYAVTGAVLIHPGYAIAAAEDIAKIHPEQLTNNTQFILWESQDRKYSMDVVDYILHPEYMEKVTIATIALLQLFTMTDDGFTNTPAPVLPICLPISGAGVFTDLYTVRMNDENQELIKETMKMSFVDNKDCEEFYYRANLNYKKMAPQSSVCVTSEQVMDPCVWDGGIALVTRQSWGFWKLLGFGVRGPGCGAPARFVNMHDYIPWIDEIVSRRPSEDELEDGTSKWLLRQLSPVKLVMVETSKIRSKETGQCDKHDRGDVIYKDNTEIVLNKNFAQGFFFLVINQIGQFTCLIVNMETSSRTNAAMWVEHYCHRDLTGLAHGVNEPLHRGDGYKKIECFMYFKSAAFIEFRFLFSFKAILEVTLYGREEIPREIPNPWVTDITTLPWWPTARIIRWGSFVPFYHWWYSL